jgi:hypothetical protein
MRILSFILLLNSCLSIAAYSQLPQVFPVRIEKIETNKYFRYVSLSNTYRASEDPDSVIIPSQFIGNEMDTVYEYIVLDSNFRAVFLQRSHLSESSFLYLYNYQTNKLIKKSVKDLKLIAVLSIYGTAYDNSVGEWDYHVGFEIDELPEDSRKYDYSLAYFGSENPFSLQPSQAMSWQEADAESDSLLLDFLLQDSLQGIVFNSYFTFENKYWKYYLLEYAKHPRHARKIIAFNKDEKNWVLNHNFLEGESATQAPLNGIGLNNYAEIFQWTGQIFKNLPVLVFGFQFHSFGCPAFFTVETATRRIPLLCDNRH